MNILASTHIRGIPVYVIVGAADHNVRTGCFIIFLDSIAKSTYCPYVACRKCPIRKQCEDKTSREYILNTYFPTIEADHPELFI